MGMTSLLVLVALLLSACAAPAPGHEGPILVGTDEVHRAELETAAGRWVAAGGVELSVGDEGEGVSVHFTPQVFLDGTEVCGRSELSDSTLIGASIHVATAPVGGACTPGRALLHEIGHLLSIGARARHFHLDEGSATLMAPSGKVSWITADDLAFVCEHAPCVTFISEHPRR